MRYLVTGASGQLGSYLLRTLRERGEEVVAWSGRGRGEHLGVPLVPVDLRDEAAVAVAFTHTRPDIVIHTAAVSAIADCYRDPATAHAINAAATARLAELSVGVRFVYVSTDLVFDGKRGNYREGDEPAPLSVYAETKCAGELSALRQPRVAVIRVSLLYGASLSGRPTFFDQQAAALREGRPITAFEDEWRTPLDLATAAEGVIRIAASDVSGLVHLGGPERMTRLDMARRLARCVGADERLVVPASRLTVGPEPRPCDTSLDSSLFRGLFPDFRFARFGDV